MSSSVTNTSASPSAALNHEIKVPILTQLPPELGAHIVSFLPKEDRQSIRLTSRHCQDLTHTAKQFRALQLIGDLEKELKNLEEPVNGDVFQKLKDLRKQLGIPSDKLDAAFTDTIPKILIDSFPDNDLSPICFLKTITQLLTLKNLKITETCEFALIITELVFYGGLSKTYPSYNATEDYARLLKGLIKLRAFRKIQDIAIKNITDPTIRATWLHAVVNAYITENNYSAAVAVVSEIPKTWILPHQIDLLFLKNCSEKENTTP